MRFRDAAVDISLILACACGAFSLALLGAWLCHFRIMPSSSPIVQILYGDWSVSILWGRTLPIYGSGIATYANWVDIPVAILVIIVLVCLAFVSMFVISKRGRPSSRIGFLVYCFDKETDGRAPTVLQADASNSTVAGERTGTGAVDLDRE